MYVDFCEARVFLASVDVAYVLLATEVISWKNSSLANALKDLGELYIYIYREREIDLCPSKRIWARILPTQIQLFDIRMQIHSIEVDLYYFKYL